MEEQQERNIQQQEQPETVSQPKKTISTFAGLTILILFAALVGSNIYWYAHSFSYTELIDVNEIVLQSPKKEEIVLDNVATEDKQFNEEQQSTAIDKVVSENEILPEVKLRILAPESNKTLCLDQNFVIRWEGPEDLSTVTLWVKEGMSRSWKIGTFPASFSESNVDGQGEYVWKIGSSEDGTIPVGFAYQISISGYYPFSENKNNLYFETKETFFIEDCRG